MREDHGARHALPPTLDSPPRLNEARPEDANGRLSTCVRAALEYARLGWKVFPVRPGAKTPAARGWQELASDDPAALKRLFETHGACNLGVATGWSSNFWALDIDPRHGGSNSFEELERHYGKLPDTVRQQTPGGGVHIFFRMPNDGRDVRNRTNVLPGIDVRGTGGFVVVPPSHMDRKPYRWEKSSGPGDVPVADAPLWLIDLLCKTNRTGGSDNLGRGKPEIILEGQRNDSLTRFAGRLRRAGMAADEIVCALNAVNLERCRPPLSEREVRRIADSIGRYPSGGAGALPSWPDLVPLPTFSQPMFPVEVLPFWGRDYVEALAEATQTPMDAAAMMFLAVLAAASAKKIKVQIDPDWSQPLNLYVAVALPPASRKTAVMKAVKQPIEDYEREQIANASPEVVRQVERRETKQKRLEMLRRKIADADSGEHRSTLEREAMEVVEDLATQPPPRLPRLIADNVTAEQLVTLLAENQGRMVVLSPEGGELFSIMAGRYSNGTPNFGVFLNAHEGDPLRVDRRGRAEQIPEPALTLALMVQPDVIRGLAAHPQFKHRGLVARFLYSIPRNTLGHRKSETLPVPPQVRERYEQRVRQMLVARYREGQVLRLEPEAREVLRAFQDRLEPGLNPETGDLAYMADWAGKLAGEAARLAAQLALADGGDPISAEIMRSAVHLAEDYLLPHARAAYAVMGADETLEDARLVLNAIMRNGAAVFSRRDLHRWLKGQERFRKVSSLDPGLRMLTEHGHVRPVAANRPCTGPGRPPSPLYDVNPALFRGAPNGGTKSPQSPEASPNPVSGDSVPIGDAPETPGLS